MKYLMAAFLLGCMIGCSNDNISGVDVSQVKRPTPVVWIPKR